MIFDKKTAFLFVLFFLPLLFIPKINLIKFGGETAGIRVDDFVILSFAFVFCWAHFSLERKTGELEKWVLIIVVFSLFSYILNRLFVGIGILHVDSKIFYCVRILEYFMFFYVGMLASQFFFPSTIVKAFVLWNLVIILLQKWGFLGSWTAYGYDPRATYRSSGIASFPSEMGALLAMAFCYLIYEDKSKYISIIPKGFRKFWDMTYIYWMFFIFAVLIVFTGARISIGALIIAFLFKLREEMRFFSTTKLLIVMVFIGISAISLPILISSTYSVFQRSLMLTSWANIELIGNVWEHIDLTRDPIGNESVAAGEHDLSWWMRIHKWCYALKIYYLHPECWLQGVGPGFAMGALDGGFLRILTEYGIIGCLLFWRFFASIWRQSLQMKWVLVVFFINMVTFDIYLAYKPMILLFLLTGFSVSAHKMKEVVPVPEPVPEKASVTSSFTASSIL